jgi:DNA-binding MarR family transcriptional regulator
MLRALLNELTGAPNTHVRAEELKYAIKEHLEELGEPVCLTAMLSDDNAEVSVAFLREVYWIVDQVGTPTVIPFVEVGGIVEREACDLAWFKDPITAEIGVPDPKDYIAAFERSLREDAPGFEIAEDALALCAVFATQNGADRFFVRDLILAAVDNLGDSPSPSTRIEKPHVEAAARSVKFRGLNVLKSPPETILFAQAYARAVNRPNGALRSEPGFAVPVPFLYSEYRQLIDEMGRSVIGTTTPAVEFEGLKSSLIQRRLFALDNRNDTITIKKEWAYAEHLDQILTFDYYTEVAGRQRRLPAVNVPPAPVATPGLDDVVNQLYLGHLAALQAIQIALTEKQTPTGEPTTITISEVYPAYVEVCQHLGLAPAGRRPGFYKILLVLEAKGLIQTRKHGCSVVCIDALPQKQSLGLSIVRKLQSLLQVPSTATAEDRTSANSNLNPQPAAGRLAPAQQLAIAAIQQSLEKTANPRALLSDIYQSYITLCQERGKAPATKQRFKQILDIFEARGLIRRERCYIGARPDSLVYLRKG